MAFAIPTHIELKKRHRSYVRHAVVASLVAHGLIFVLSPPFSFKPYELGQVRECPIVIELPPDLTLPVKPKDISPPEIQVTARNDTDIPDDQYPGTSPIDFRDFTHPSVPPSNPNDGFMAFDQMPILVHFEGPTYPKLARQAGFEGRVFIEVLIGEDGRVIRARIVFSEVSAAMERAALSAAKKCLFEPARQRTTPVKARVVIPFEFRLN
jgi:protein TonB